MNKKIIKRFVVWQIGENWNKYCGVFNCKFQAKKFTKKNPLLKYKIQSFEILAEKS